MPCCHKRDSVAVLLSFYHENAAFRLVLSNEFKKETDPDILSDHYDTASDACRIYGGQNDK